MNLVLTEEQAQIAETARRFVDEHSPLERFRKQRGVESFSRAVWQAMAEMGWQALVVPEEHGGLGLGMAELTIVLEAMGRNLATEPFWSTVLLAGQTIAVAGDESQKARWLPGIADGELVATLAYQEADSRYDLRRCFATATEVDGGFALNGAKTHVPDGGVADLVLVLARTSGGVGDRDGLTLFALDPGADGVTRVPERRIDERNAATIVLDGAVVGADAVVGELGEAWGTIDAILDRAFVGLAAEMLGAATHAMEITLDYMRERVQFGVPIASFQALQHRMAHVYERVELARSAVMGAARAVDAGSDDASAFASMAKVQASRALELAAKEGVQFHGGVGMTDEYDIGFFLKRHRAAEVTLGDRSWHLRRWAAQRGY